MRPGLILSSALVQDGGSHHPVLKLLRHLEISNRQLEILFAEIEILDGSGLFRIKGCFLSPLCRLLHNGGSPRFFTITIRKPIAGASENTQHPQVELAPPITPNHSLMVRA
jgi:hypothetical protein